MRELINLWERTLGDTPSDQQFFIWTESHPMDIVRQAILKTATKNQTMSGTMDADHKVRFASKVMLTASAQRHEHAENRRKLQEEFGATAAQVATAPTGDSNQEAGSCAS